jgi:nitroimidazol reductase NimA-like FMN-containing flavoprotein (pyridoxamine 5'-phosphate oxidase superfamily)
VALSKKDREDFLAQPSLVATIAISTQQGRGPLAVPVWYHYEVGEEPWLVTYAASRKAQMIKTTGAFTLSVARSEPTVRYVTVDGLLGRVEKTTAQQLAQMAARYLAGDPLARYLAAATPTLGELVTMYMTPQHWNSGDLGTDYSNA